MSLNYFAVITKTLLTQYCLYSDESSRHCTKHAERIHRTIFDAAQHNLSHHAYEVISEEIVQTVCLS